MERKGRRVKERGGEAKARIYCQQSKTNQERGIYEKGRSKCADDWEWRILGGRKGNRKEKTKQGRKKHIKRGVRRPGTKAIS